MNVLFPRISFRWLSSSCSTGPTQEQEVIIELELFVVCPAEVGTVARAYQSNHQRGDDAADKGSGGDSRKCIVDAGVDGRDVPVVRVNAGVDRGVHLEWN